MGINRLFIKILVQYAKKQVLDEKRRKSRRMLDNCMEYKVGDVIEVLVTGIKNYGIFINTMDDYSGLIHISEISANYVRNVSDYVKEGELIQAKILDVDEKKHQLKLSIKDFDYRINKKNRGKIVETTTGFTTLKEQLPTWILQKEKELSNIELKK